MDPKTDAMPRRAAHLQIWFHRANSSMDGLIAPATAEDGTNPGASVRLSDRFHPLNDLEGGAGVILKPHSQSKLGPHASGSG
jgi:hypothetical protein